MRKQISNLDFSMHYIIGIASSLFAIAFCITIGVSAVLSFKDELGLSIFLIIILPILSTITIRYTLFCFKLVDVIINDQEIIIERFLKKQKLPFSAIKETKYFFPNFIDVHIFEPRIKITFNQETIFGKTVYILPTSLDEKNSFRIDAGIKNILDSKIKN